MCQNKSCFFFLSFERARLTNLQTRCLVSLNVNMHKATDAAHVRSPGTCFFFLTQPNHVANHASEHHPGNKGRSTTCWLCEKMGGALLPKQRQAAKTCNLWFCQQQLPKLVVGACSISMYKKYFYCTGGGVKYI